MSICSDLPSVCYYLSHLHQRSRWMRRTRKYPFLIEAVPWQDVAASVSLVTKGWGIVLWGEVWPYDDQLRHGWVGCSARLNRMLDHYRMALLSPERFSVFREDWPMERDFPRLHWHLTADRTEAGQPRDRSRLNVWVSNDRWKGFVRDMNTRLLCWGDGPTFGDLLRQLDARLCGGRDLWRRDRYFHGDAGRNTEMDT